jgi:hypothetical protein
MTVGRLVIWALAIELRIGQADSTASLTLLAGQVAAVESAANNDRVPTFAILFDDAAGISPPTLIKAQAIATNVFRQGGVHVRWSNCSFSDAEHRGPTGCQLSLDVPTLIVKVLPDAASRRWGPPATRLGFCVDKDVYLLMPAIIAVANQQGLPISLVLGHALVHEAGHALLGPGHSQGLMRPEFGKADWRRAEKGQLLFVPNDAHRIRERLVKLAGGR